LAIAEAFRKLRTNLQFLAVDNPPRVIVVTSSTPSEGKSITTINIALALAEAEHNVVLVDGDTRRPVQEPRLGGTGRVQHSAQRPRIIERGSAKDTLSRPDRPHVRGYPPNPSELLGSLAAKKLLSEMRAQLDSVIVDSSPLLAVTDAAILAASSDGVLIMAPFGQTKREQLAHAVEHLKDVGASILGAVFTMVPTRGNASYSYSYSHYGKDSARRPSHRKPPAEPAALNPRPSTDVAPPRTDAVRRAGGTREASE
jgi:capsular exopolysaccharide synthesis family protein